MELLGHAPDRESMLQLFSALDWGVMATDFRRQPYWKKNRAIQMKFHEIGRLEKRGAVLDENGDEIAPAQIVEGHSFNIKFYGQTAAKTAEKFMSVDEEGSVSWDYDAIAATLAAKAGGTFTLKDKSEKGVKAGYEHDTGVRLFDPATINKRARVWA